MALDSVAGLLETVARLPEGTRALARARVAAALELPAPACRVALGLLALDLADGTPDTGPTRLSA